MLDSELAYNQIVSQMHNSIPSDVDVFQIIYFFLTIRILPTSLTSRPESDVKRNDLLNSYLHMMNNRFFRTRQRLHELLLYDFLALYYRSRLARQKS